MRTIACDFCFTEFRTTSNDDHLCGRCEDKRDRIRAETLEEAAKAVCGYVAGRCNSNRCPCHIVHALAKGPAEGDA